MFTGKSEDNPEPKNATKKRKNSDVVYVGGKIAKMDIKPSTSDAPVVVVNPQFSSTDSDKLKLTGNEPSTSSDKATNATGNTQPTKDNKQNYLAQKREIRKQKRLNKDISMAKQSNTTGNPQTASTEEETLLSKSLKMRKRKRKGKNVISNDVQQPNASGNKNPGNESKVAEGDKVKKANDSGAKDPGNVSQGKEGLNEKLSKIKSADQDASVAVALDVQSLLKCKVQYS